MKIYHLKEISLEAVNDRAKNLTKFRDPKRYTLYYYYDDHDSTYNIIATIAN